MPNLTGSRRLLGYRAVIPMSDNIQQYVLTDANDEPITGEQYDDPERAINARARLMAEHPDSDMVTVAEVRGDE